MSNPLQSGGIQRPYDPLADASPDGRVAVGQSAFDRQLPRNKKPQRELKKYRVTLDGDSREIDALDANEAWAKFCDEKKHWPSPRTSGRTVELISESV
jgi:hypothetical protein